MKKFFSFLLIFCVIFCSLTLTGCAEDEISKISKNLTAYSIEIELDESDMTIDGVEVVDFVNKTGQKIDEICFHLYARAFREGALVKPYTKLTSAVCFPNGISYGNLDIVSVKINGEIKPFEYGGEDEDILKVALGFCLDANKHVQIEITFKLTIPNSTHRFGYYMGNINLGNWYPIVCSFSNGVFDTSPYYATGDPFCSDIANYRLKFIFPKKYMICSTGEISLLQNDDKICANMKANAVRDFAICLSCDSNVTSRNVAGVNLQFVSNRKSDENVKYLEISAKALEFFNKNFGKYPFKTLTVVSTPFIYGGMEYPNIVFISDSIDDEIERLKVIVHEIAHQWWYGLVGNDETREAWLDESLSEYSTALFFEHNPQYGLTYDDFVGDALSSYLLYVDVISTLKGEVNTKMDLPVYEYQNDYEYSYMVYVKGVIMFDSLKTMVGEKKILAGFRKYFSSNKFKIAHKKDFLDAFKKACHKDLDGFFESFLNGSAIISQIN